MSFPLDKPCWYQHDWSGYRSTRTGLPRCQGHEKCVRAVRAWNLYIYAWYLITIYFFKIRLCFSLPHCFVKSFWFESVIWRSSSLSESKWRKKCFQMFSVILFLSSFYTECQGHGAEIVRANFRAVRAEQHFRCVATLKNFLTFKVFCFGTYYLRGLFNTQKLCVVWQF